LVEINAYSSNESLSGKKIALLVCNDENIPKNDLKNLEFERHIKKVLEAKGYTFTSDHDKADVVVFYEYGISDPIEYTSQRTVPVWGQTGIAGSKTTQKRDFLGRTVYETRNIPSRGVVGSRVETNTHTKYLKWANINAYDADFYRQTGEDRMLWIIEMTNTNSENDLRYIFPRMMAAAYSYIGQSSGAKQTERISDSNPMIYPDRLLTAVVNEPIKNKRDNINITVHQDMYRDGRLFIKAGTPVSVGSVTRSGLGGQRYLFLHSLSTTSVDGNPVAFARDVSFLTYYDKPAVEAGTLLYLIIKE
jgi:hypothetical protein